MSLPILKMKTWLPHRRPTDNKSHGGRALLIAGSKSMPGAGLLAAKSASRVGSGYVYVSSREVLKFFPEAIPWNKKTFNQFTGVLIGPGAGLTKTLLSQIKELKKNSVPVVIDADALTLAARHKLYPFPEHWIATPHTGELARLLNTTASAVETDRLAAARAAQKKLNCIILLKGFHSLLVLKNKFYEISSGNVALAKGGSGDVLAGMICGFLAQKVNPERAALLACYLHGLMADQWVKSKKDVLSLTPSDLIEAIPEVLHNFRKNSGLRGK